MDVQVDQWVFVESNSTSNARRIVTRHFVDQPGCDWAVAAEVTGRAVEGEELVRVVSDVARRQRHAVQAMWEQTQGLNLPDLVAGFDPYRAADDVLFAVGSGLFRTLGGFWTPASGGWDAVAQTADLSAVRTRLKATPGAQFAVPVQFTV